MRGQFWLTGGWFQQAMQKLRPGCTLRLMVHAGIKGNEAAVLRDARKKFGVTQLDESRIEFVFLSLERLLKPSTWPRLTLLGQSLGFAIVGAEALFRSGCPFIFLDTIGNAFTYPVAWLCGCTVISYTHYPVISTDMLQRVYERRPAYNNDELVAQSAMNSRAKYVYYLAFCFLYRFVGQFAHVVMVNSHWTSGHIDQLWMIKSLVVFPPCDTKQFAQARRSKKDRVIVSLGQFRPEKDHRLQIQALAALKQLVGESRLPDLVMYGSCRDAQDEMRTNQLASFAVKLGVSDHVKFKVNVPFTELKERMGSALLGIHTMWNEHFGIAPVEMLAAGIILIAHDSGGPKLDIIDHGRTGFLASTADEYACCIAKVLDWHDSGPEAELEQIRDRASDSVDRFAQEVFERDFQRAVDKHI